MAKRGIFQRFMAELRRQWATELPTIARLRSSRAGLPQSSSFYAGRTPEDLHAFLWFQHSAKPWEVGEFTINVYLEEEQNPERIGGSAVHYPINTRPDRPGTFRVGDVVCGKDKWYCLAESDPTYGIVKWRPDAYHDEERLLLQALAEVTADVVTTLEFLGIAQAPDR